MSPKSISWSTPGPKIRYSPPPRGHQTVSRLILVIDDHDPTVGPSVKCVAQFFAAPRPSVSSWTNQMYDRTMVFFVCPPPRGPPWTKGSCSRRCSSPRPSVSSVDPNVCRCVLRVPSPWTKGSCSRPQFLRVPVKCAALRGQKEVAVAVAVLRGPSWSSGSQNVAVTVLRVPSRPFADKRKLQVAVAVLRGPPCPPM